MKTLQWLKENPYWCQKPFDTIQIYYGKNGLVNAPCCNYTSPRKVDLGFKELLSDIQAGKKNNACSTCHKQELVNDNSERIRDSLTNVPKPNIYNIGIQFSNLCNLACRSCSSFQSSLYASLHNINLDPHITTDITEDSRWPQILEIIDDAAARHETIFVSAIGGETMLQKGMKSLVEYLIEKNYAEKTVFGITTNFTTIDFDWMNQFTVFKELYLTASIDSTGQNYHYVRWPARFEKIQKNLDAFFSFKKNTKSNITLSIASVFSLNNIFYINEYLDFLQQQWQRDQKLNIHNIHLVVPDHLSVENLPLKYRSKLHEYIQPALNHPILDHATEMKTFLIGLSNFLKNNQQTNQHKFNYFLKFTAQFDAKTGCSFEVFNNRLFEILDESDRKCYQQPGKLSYV